MKHWSKLWVLVKGFCDPLAETVREKYQAVSSTPTFAVNDFLNDGC